jgi:4-amino-4-deoxy-L-arabinose transferase-like glycosyltransferase
MDFRDRILSTFHRTGWLQLVVLCLALYGSGMTLLPPVDRDEARFAQASRQMLENRDFVRIRFQEEPRHKKPIGIHWLQAGIAAATGMRDRIWPYRLSSLLGALLAVVLTAYCGTILFDASTGRLAGWFLAGCLLLTVEAHLATTDAMLLATVVAAQGALAKCYLRSRDGLPVGVGTALAFWTAQGLGWLLKGPIISLISVLTAGTLCLADRDVRWLKTLRIPWGLILLAAMLSPWAIAISIATQGSFFNDAIRSDLLPKLMGSQESHGFPPGFYMLLMPLTFWPASLFAGVALYQAWAQRKTTAERFCLAWCLPTWLVFELIPTKLPHYILPLYPALAMLCARVVTGVTGSGPAPIHNRWLRLGCGAWAAMTILMGAALVAFPWWIAGGFQPLTVVPAAAATATAMLAVHRLLRGRPQNALRILVLGSLLTLAPTFHTVLPSLDPLWLSRSIAKAVAADQPATGLSQVPVAAVGYDEPSLIFLLGTGTKLLSAEEAACYLGEHPEALVVITSGENEQAFQQKVADLGIVVQNLRTLRGFNYTKGRWLTVRLYTRE